MIASYLMFHGSVQANSRQLPAGLIVVYHIVFAGDFGCTSLGNVLGDLLTE